MTEYQKLLDAVARYYGAGSDEWLTIASQSNIQSTEWAQILSQTPDVNIVTNKAGQIVSYTVNESWGTAADTITGAVNSNTQVATMANASQVAIPANNSISQQGYAVAESGLKEVNGGYTVGGILREVATGVAAVGAGMRLGAAIDSTLYNLNPDFWDENGMSSLNPETWNSLVSDYGEGAQSVFNMFFGINSNTGKTQAYMDERAFAYIAQYMSYKGAFDTGAETWDGNVPAGSGWTDVTEPLVKSQAQFTATDFDGVQNFYEFGEVTYQSNPPWRVGIRKSMQSASAPELPTDTAVASWNDNNHLSGVWASKENFTNSTFTYFDAGGTRQGGAGGVTTNSFTYDTKTVYYGNANITNLQWADDLGSARQSDIRHIAWLLQYGTFEGGGGVEGITTQSGATTPTGITPTMPLGDVIAYLKTLYPEMWDDAIYDDVIQQDGTITRIIYVPTGLPEEIVKDAETGVLKITGGQEKTQDDTEVDEDDPDDIVDTLLKILTATDPYNPLVPPPPTTDYPDTGDGETPAVVTPTGSASALYKVYNPTQSQLESFGAWLWSSNFVDQLLKLFNDPMQAIIGLHKVFATPSIGGTANIKVGYLDSGVSSSYVSAQYTEVDCGTVSLKEYFGNALDYTNTDIYLYLPFVGIVPVSTLDVVRSDITVKYKVDVLTGACMAQVYVNRDNNAGGQLYCYAGDCAVKYPLSSGSYMGIVSSVLGIAGGVVGTIASGGAMLPLALGAGASALNSARTSIEHSGSLSGNAGAMGIKKPYFIIRRPQTKIADNFQLLAGESQNEYGILSSYTGQTRVKYVHLENIPATDKELTQIEELLKSGVLI